MYVLLSLDGRFATGVSQSTGYLAHTWPSSGQRCPRFSGVLRPPDRCSTAGINQRHYGLLPGGMLGFHASAGSAWGAVKGKMASFPSMAVVRLAVREISTIPISKVSLNLKFQIFWETEVHMETNKSTHLRESRLLQSYCYGLIF